MFNKLKNALEILFSKYARKALITALYMLSSAVAAGTIPEPWNSIAIAVLAVLASRHVYVTENAPEPPQSRV